jgi:hypothetical protein
MAIYIAANNFLQQEAILTGNFDKTKVDINCTLKPNKVYNFPESEFNYASNSLFTMGFTQPSPEVYGLLSDSNKNNISKALNINIDSLLLQENKYYSLDVTAIKPRMDSAISYTYDDDFNKVEKVVVNNVQEPIFNFTVGGENVTNIYAHWQRTHKLEQTNVGELFTVIPFAKSYCNVKNKKELNISSSNYQSTTLDKKINCIFFLNIFFTKIPADILKYMPTKITKPIANIESLQIEAMQKEGKKIFLHCRLNEKKNSFPIINW